MLRLDDPGLDAATARALDRYQALVDAAGDYAAQVEAAQGLFKSRNTAQNPTFRVIRQKLGEMCAARHRCGWCEDSEAGQIDHIRPKTLYPERTFVWENYLGSCGICNNSKGDRFAILLSGVLVDVSRRRNQPAARPPKGASALIDPRAEDPLDFLELEARNTFHLLPKYGLSQLDRDRATYTIKLLSLNRDALTAARRNTFKDNCELLRQYSERRQAGACAEDLGRVRNRASAAAASHRLA